MSEDMSEDMKGSLAALGVLLIGINSVGLSVLFLCWAFSRVFP